MISVMGFEGGRQNVHLALGRSCEGNRKEGGRWRRNLWETLIDDIFAEDVFGRVNHSKDPESVNLRVNVSDYTIRAIPRVSHNTMGSRLDIRAAAMART